MFCIDLSSGFSLWNLRFDSTLIGFSILADEVLPLLITCEKQIIRIWSLVGQCPKEERSFPIDFADAEYYAIGSNLIAVASKHLVKIFFIDGKSTDLPVIEATVKGISVVQYFLIIHTEHSLTSWFVPKNGDPRLCFETKSVMCVVGAHMLY